MSCRRLFAVAIAASAVASGCAKETIAHQQDERNANRIVFLLAGKGIEADKLKDAESRDIRFNILVAKDDKISSLGLLEQHNLPETLKMGTLDLFKEGGLIPTSEQERAKREAGIAGDISNGLRRIGRVVEAVVTVSLPEDNPLRDVNEAKPKPKCSVILEYLPDSDNRPPVTVEDVQQFAHGALPEIKSADVAVQLIPHKAASTNGTGGGAGAASGAAVLPENMCEKTKVAGIEICSGNKVKAWNVLIVGAVFMAILSGMIVVSVLRALRYKKDLTRLTAQVQNLRK